MTKLQKRVKAHNAAKKRGIAAAVKTLLKKTNPSAMITGASVVKLKGGGLTIRPIKKNPGRKGSMYGLVHRGVRIAAYSNQKAARLARTSVFGHLKGVKIVKVSK